MLKRLGSKYVNMVLNVLRNRKAYQGRREGGGVMEVREEGERYTVTTRMIPALRWAATRAVLMFSRK